MDRFTRLWRQPITRVATVVTLLAMVLGSGALVANHFVPKAQAVSSCQLNSVDGNIQHVIYLQFDNTHFNQDNPNVPSDLAQMPHLLNFLTQNGTLFTNDHTILISHTAGGILSSLTGLYPDRQGQTVSNSYDYFAPSGSPFFTSSFKYWTNPVDGSNDSLPNMVTDGQKTTPAPWVPFTRAGCDFGGVGTANIELENATAATFTAGPTSLAAAASAGDTNIKVGKVSGFAAGQTASLDIGANAETAQIASVGTAGASGTGITFTAPLAKVHAVGVPVYVAVPNPSGDITNVFGAGSPEWIEATQAAAYQQTSPPSAAIAKIKGQAQTDFVGIAIHCAQTTTSKCASNANAKPDPLPDEPGGYNGYQALYGTKYVDPAITGGNPCVNDTAGNPIADPDGNCGFPGFDGMLANNTLGYIEQMQESGVPITYGYISDAHDFHVPSTTSDAYVSSATGPGEATHDQQLAAYDDAFAAFFQNLAAHGINKSNTLFVVTVDEGDHFAGGTASPAGCDGVNTACTYSHTICTDLSACPANQIGEVDANMKALLAPDYAPNPVPGFDIHFDDAPTFYVNGNPARTDPNLRQLERNVGALTSLDPYVRDSAGNVQTVNLTQALADPVEEQALHMVNSDPARTPSFTMFGNPDFFFQLSSCNGVAECANPGFAWNHGDIQQEIGNTWVGIVGPGVQNNGIDSTTWTDHTNLRPTILSLVGLHDDYVQDGRVLIEALTTHATPQTLIAHRETVRQLGDVYEQLNAAFGQFSADTLKASTRALESTSSGDATYTSIENSIQSLTSQRNVLASQIKSALNAAAFDGQALNEQQAQSWIDQAQQLLSQADALAAGN